MNSKHNDFKVADLSLADWGRKEIVIAQSEMPALMKLRKIYTEKKPFERSKDIRLHSYDHTNCCINRNPNFFGSRG